MIQEFLGGFFFAVASRTSLRGLTGSFQSLSRFIFQNRKKNEFEFLQKFFPKNSPGSVDEILTRSLPRCFFFQKILLEFFPGDNSGFLQQFYERFFLEVSRNFSTSFSYISHGIFSEVSFEYFSDFCSFFS